MRVLVFGDSITQGYWDVKGGWVDRLREYFDTKQFTDLRHNDEPTIFNLGISADTSRSIIARLEAEVVARTRHGELPVVIVQIGVNDSSTGEGAEGFPVEEYEHNLERIIELAKPISSKLIFIGLSAADDAQTNPVFWNEVCYSSHRIKLYEDKMAEVAARHGVAFIPLYEGFKARLDAGENLLPDGLHPNDAGHELIYQLVKPELEKLLQ